MRWSWRSLYRLVMTSTSLPNFEIVSGPPHDCPHCPRLEALRQTCRAEQPDWWNAPVPDFGDRQARILIVGLAPGRQGANRTGRAFTGDGSGDLLFATLARLGLCEGYEGRADDGLRLNGVAIANAVKCLPPDNLPTPQEVRTCRPFLAETAGALPQARTFVALGQTAHQSTVKMLGGRLPKTPFAHLAEHRMPDGRMVIDSYHCSRRNISTGKLTESMLIAVFERAMVLAGL